MSAHDAHVRAWSARHNTRPQDAQVGAWLRFHARRLARQPLADGFEPAALHEYADADGCPLHWRIRLKHPQTGEKWIRPLRRRDGGGFELQQPDYPDGAPLYRLPDLAAQPDARVWIVEGETCADALAALGLVATTSGGADSAGRADWRALAGRAVAIWGDFDDAGQRYADAVAGILRGLGCAVVTLDPSALNLPHKGDCVDWLAAHSGATADDMAALLPEDAPGPTPGFHQPAPAPDDAEEPDADRIARLAALPPLAYDRARKDEAKALGVRPATLDAEVKAARGEDGDAGMFPEVEPWADPVNPADLLDDLAATVRRFIVLDARQADAAALWVAFTWFADVVDVAPLAIINAPERECGKSLLLAVFAKLVARPLPAANATAAFLFRAVELWEPTLLIDEADTFVRDNEELKGLVNAGHTRDAAYVGRVVGDDHTPKLFKVWGEGARRHCTRKAPARRDHEPRRRLQDAAQAQRRNRRTPAPCRARHVRHPARQARALCPGRPRRRARGTPRTSRCAGRPRPRQLVHVTGRRQTGRWGMGTPGDGGGAGTHGQGRRFAVGGERTTGGYSGGIREEAG